MNWSFSVPRACCVSAALALAACGDDGGTADGGRDGTTAGSSASDANGTQGSSGAGTTVAASTAADSTAGPPEPGTDSGSSGGTTGATDTREPKSLMIAIDGLRPDSLAMANTPAIDSLIDGSWQDGYAGAYVSQAQCLTDADSVSGPNHWAIMTGATGRQHGVTSNGDVGSGDGTNFPHYLTLLEAHNPDWVTAYLFTWVTDIQVPCEADYISFSSDEANSQQVAEMVAGTLATTEGVLKTQWTEGDDPDAIFLFLDNVDGAGHGFGFGDAPDYLAAIETIDSQVGAIFDAVAARPTFADERWQIVITTDHGGIGTSHGGMTPEELTIPFLVASPAVVQGELPAATEAEGTRIFDTVPTALEHMGVAIPEALTGHSRAGG